MTDKQRNMVMNALKMGGLFVTCGSGEEINIMITRWGTIGRMWNRDVFVLPVRKKKYSHELISKYKSFVINIPTPDMMTTLQNCAKISGHDVDKFKEFGFDPVPAKLVHSIGIEQCAVQFECKVICTSEMRSSKVNSTIARDMYIGREYHTLFFGEIVRSSVEKKGHND